MTGIVRIIKISAVTVLAKITHFQDHSSRHGTCPPAHPGLFCPGCIWCSGRTLRASFYVCIMYNIHQCRQIGFVVTMGTSCIAHQLYVLQTCRRYLKQMNRGTDRLGGGGGRERERERER